jgi:hypothetical protein
MMRMSSRLSSPWFIICRMLPKPSFFEVQVNAAS